MKEGVSKNNKKTAWIFPGGAARAVYTAGVIYGLCEAKIKDPDIIIASSGSAPTSLCYLSGQKEVIKNVWLGHLSSRKFLNFWRFWKVMDIDFLVDTAIRKLNTLDIKTITSSPITVFIPLTNAETGKIRYFSNKMNVDLWKVIKASVFVPIWANLFSVKGIGIDGKFYTDSAPASRFTLNVEKALEEGADKIIVFDNWHPDDNPTGFFFSKSFTYMRNREYRKNQLKYFKEMESFTKPKNVDFLHLSPSKKLSMHRFENDNQHAQKVFYRGIADVKSAVHLIEN